MKSNDEDRTLHADDLNRSAINNSFSMDKSKHMEDKSRRSTYPPAGYNPPVPGSSVIPEGWKWSLQYFR